MKKLLLILAIVFFQNTIAQEINTTTLKDFNAEDVTSKFLKTNSKADLIKFKEIIPVEIFVTNNNSEGKYLVSSPKSDIVKENFIKENIDKDRKPENITTELKKEFVYKLIIEKLVNNNKDNISQFNLNEIYGDSNIDLYKNYDAVMNKLISSYQLNEEIELEIGKSVLPFINQIYKSELDKTLNHSLNLVAINF